MKTINGITTGDSKALVLHQLVDVIIAEATAVKIDKTRIVNNVSADLLVSVPEHIIGPVLKGLIRAFVENTTEGDIQITAKLLFSNTVRVFIRDNNCYNTYAVACGLQKMVPLAEQMGGFLNILNQRQRITTIEFSFPVSIASGEDEEG